MRVPLQYGDRSVSSPHPAGEQPFDGGLPHGGLAGDGSTCDVAKEDVRPDDRDALLGEQLPML
jgi:hypothetical protein